MYRHTHKSNMHLLLHNYTLIPTHTLFALSLSPVTGNGGAAETLRRRFFSGLTPPTPRLCFFVQHPLTPANSPPIRLTKWITTTTIRWWCGGHE
ncbi:hypothetical protein Hanom_Chr14g01276791 [Helianthus anomalus]